METRVIKLADIKPAPYNPRVQLTPKDQEYKALDASIEENGLVLPLIVNIRDNCLIGGHQRLSVQQLIDDGENLLATGFTQADIDDLLGEIGGELGEDEEPPSLGKKEDTADGIKCIVGDFSFRLEEAEFEDLMADVREKVGFTQELVCAELKGRLFDEV